jgi:hypothetical protein
MTAKVCVPRRQSLTGRSKSVAIATETASVHALQAELDRLESDRLDRLDALYRNEIRGRDGK